jgi:hypothetical protein
VVKFLDALTGMFRPDRNDVADVAPPAQPPRLIVGGSAAPELCMIACDANLPAGREAEIIAEQSRTPHRVVQLKADGINAMYLEGRMITGREGTPLECALHCQPGLRRIEDAMGTPTVFFGEYVANDGFNATVGEHKAGKGDGVFWLYDAIPHGAWVTGDEYLVPIEQRLNTLRRAFLGTDVGQFVGFLDFWLLTPAETAAKAAEMWAAGFEGLVSKQAGSGFARRRDDRWLKVKQRFTVKCPVVDTIERDGQLRTIIVRGPEMAGRKTIKLTGGWDLHQADTIKRGMAMTGDGVDVSVAFELTTGTTRSIRSPKFKGIAA